MTALVRVCVHGAHAIEEAIRRLVEPPERAPDHRVAAPDPVSLSQAAGAGKT